MCPTGSGGGAGVPQLHRHRLLPAAEALPPGHAAPPQVPLQGLRQDPHRLWRRGVLYCQEQLQVQDALLFLSCSANDARITVTWIQGWGNLW